jgi:hypothetical protein
LFALKSPLENGVLLADEVGLGKTIEAGIVLCQYWAERRRRLLVICPASLSKQWQAELSEKFNLPAEIRDSRSYRDSVKRGVDPFGEEVVYIISIHYASRMHEELKQIPWDLAVIDEAHKLRNVHRPSNKMGRNIRWALEGEQTRKLLLTATPLQNSLLELYGLSTLIDERIFGSRDAFRAQFMGDGESQRRALQERISTFANRTLRKDVGEYISFTERQALTQPFQPTDEESHLYADISSFVQRKDSYALPDQHSHLTGIIVRKLLASSSDAVAGTLEALRDRLISLREGLPPKTISELAEDLVRRGELDPDEIEGILEEDEEQVERESDAEANVEQEGDESEMGAPGATAESERDQSGSDPVDRVKLEDEIAELDRLAKWSKSIEVDTKSYALLDALKIGFAEMEQRRGARKAVIFTESRRTQDYLLKFLELNGYRGKVVPYSGSNTSSQAKEIYAKWLDRQEDRKATSTRSLNVRAALLEEFEGDAEILLATEAAAEGVNLQFCSLVINYDLPWNPQRIEQRIGRCHRYGQKHDVVVINFLNEQNEIDRRVLELLTEKCKLFDGVFGSSDEILGQIDAGMDFEQRVLEIYRTCRTAEEIDASFKALQVEMEPKITNRMEEVQQVLFHTLDESVTELLRLRLDDTRGRIDRFGRRFWAVTQHILKDKASFDTEGLFFDLEQPPIPNIDGGRYHLISKDQKQSHDSSIDQHSSLYRLSHPLGEYVLESAKGLGTDLASVEFDLSGYPLKLAGLEPLLGTSGFLQLSRITVSSFSEEEHLVFSAITDGGEALDQEVIELMFGCGGRVVDDLKVERAIEERLASEADQRTEATVNKVMERTNQQFEAERDQLDRWAEAMVEGLEEELRKIKNQIKAAQNDSRKAETVEQKKEAQERVKELEKQRKSMRDTIFAREDELSEQRDELVEQLSKRMNERVERERLFVLRWSVV